MKFVSSRQTLMRLDTTERYLVVTVARLRIISRIFPEMQVTVWRK